MNKIRVLIVDDSAIVRKILTEALSSEPTIEVVGTAANGKIALAKIAQLKPDLVTLDVEMPVMDGLETLTEIRQLYPQLPVIMFSSLTERGASITLEALARGANDYIAKPSNAGSLGGAVKNVREELIPKIQVFCNRHAGTDSRIAPPAGRSGSARITGNQPGAVQTSAPQAGAPSQPGPSGRRPRLEAVVIGTSTGGPNALTAVLPQIPADFPVPLFIVQHMPPVFTARLAERLDQLSAIRVLEAVQGMVVQPGHAYLAPGDFHLTMARKGTDVRIALNQELPECSCRPAVDVLFRSAVKTYGANLLAVVLTGMGQDGLKGSELVRQAGGLVWAQDEPSSVVWGMPGAVARAGLCQQILPLNRVASELNLLMHQSLVSRQRSLSGVQV